MGRLKIRRPSPKQATPWILPFIAGGLIVFCFHSVGVQRKDQSFREDVAENRLKVGTETVGGFQQVFYDYKGKKTFVTSGETNHLNPSKNNEYIAWIESDNFSSKIVIYNVFDQKTVRITHGSGNANPVPRDGKVVWERAKEGVSTIYYFDGLGVVRVSGAYPAVRPVLGTESLAYAQQTPMEWQVVQRGLIAASDSIVARGDEASAWPHFVGDQLRTTYAEYARFNIGNLNQ